MEAIALLIIFGFIVAVVLYSSVVAPAVRSFRRARQDKARWVVDEEERNGATYVFIRHPLDGRVYIGWPIPHSLSHAEYDDLLLEARAEAEDRAAIKSLRA